VQFDALHVQFCLRERAIVLLSGQAARNFNIITKGPVILIFILNLGEYSRDKWHSALGFVILTLPSCPPGTLMHYRLWITAASLGFVTLIFHNCKSGNDCSLVHSIHISQVKFLVS